MIRWRWHQVESPEPEIALPNGCIPGVVVAGGSGIGGFLISYWQPQYDDDELQRF